MAITSEAAIPLFIVAVPGAKQAAKVATGLSTHPTTGLIFPNPTAQGGTP